MSRFALLATAGYFAYRMAKRFIRRIKPVNNQKYLGPGTDLVKCPRCYTYVPVDGTILSNVGGRRERFCGPECLEAYRRDQQDVQAHSIDSGEEMMKDE